MKDNPYGDHVYWMSDEDYQKASTQLRLQFIGIFEPFRCYGLEVFIPGAVEEAVKLAEDFGLRVRGVDHPLSLDQVRQKGLGRGKVA